MLNPLQNLEKVLCLGGVQMEIFQLELTCNASQSLYDMLIGDQAPQNTGGFSGTTSYRYVNPRQN